MNTVKLYQHLTSDKKEQILSKQLLRCSTSVGAMIREAEYAESKADFIHKMSVAQKEINESLYWLELLFKTKYLVIIEFQNYTNEATEILKIITSIIKKLKGISKTNPNP
ncbi:four helix bundle protein [Cytophagaceae bacterium 50C-KIRBA]|uniref:Four helix bundle protein n=1 Tax=Aquirufa beregesia TaxID=2516556 RepID=A0ABX0ER75_9BACT|nr:four helix bundle protein [Aquirufa beregesia]